MAKITGIKVGTTTITASYGGKSSSVSNFRVTAIAPVLEYSNSVADDTTYDGTNKCLGGMVYTGDGIGYYYVSTSSTVPSASASGWVRADGQTSPHEDYKIYNGTGATGAGTYYIFFKSTAGTNYTAVNPKLVGNITISKQSVTVNAPSFVSNTLTYNGSDQNLTTGGSASPAVGTMYYYASTSSTTPTFNASTWTTGAAEGLDAGTYNVWYYYQADSANYSGSNINTVKKLSGTKVINQKTVSLTWSTPTSWTYDGSSKSVTCTAGSLVSGDSCTVTVTNNTIGPNVGSKTASASSLSNSNYKLPSSGTSTQISITQKEVELVWGTKSWLYDGSAHGTTCSVKSTSLVGSDTCTVTLSGNSITYVGSTTVTATELSNSNYKLPSNPSTSISITKPDPTITVTGVNNVTYTGSKIYAKLTSTNIKGTIYWRKGSAPTTSTYTGKTDITSTGSMSVDLGYVQYVSENHTMYWLFVPSSAANSLSSGHTYAENYNNGSGSVAMTLAKKAITIPTISAFEDTYDRAAHSLTFPAVDGASITKYQTSTNGSTWTDASPATTNPSLTNAGTLYVRAYYEADGNHSGSGYTTGKTIKINQKEIGLSWGTRTWTYDGSTHSTTCSATGVITGDTCNVTLTGNSVGKNVGSATVTASSLSNSNYKLPSTKTTTISITQREVTLTWGTTSWPYDGTAKSTTCTAGNLVTGDTCTVTLTGNSITNVGSTTVTASELSNDNYKLPSTKTATLTITSGTLTVTATPYSGTYDGATHAGITAISAKNQAGTAVSPTFTYCATENGTYTSTIPTVKNVTTGTKIYYKATLTGYTTATGYATAVVTAKTATLTFGNLTHTYDSTSHTATCVVSNLESGDTCTVTLSNASRTNQGTQTVMATALSNSNYALPSTKTATLTINKRPINVTAASDTKVYDGTALTNSNATAEATGTNRGLVSGHSMTSCTVTGTQTTVGTSNNVPSAAVIKSGNTDVTDNYNITYVNGTLKVTARTVTVTAPAFVTGTLTYNGSNQTVASGGSCTTGGTMYYYISTTNSIPTFSTSTWSTAQNIQAKDAGTYYVWYYCKVDDTTNNTGSGLNTVTKLANSKAIGQKEVTLTWGTASWVYDGNTKSTTCTAGNLVSGDSCTVNLSGNSVGPHVGSATVTASSLSNSNYKLPSSGTTKSISITQREVTLTWGTLSWVYNGSARSTTCTAGNLISGDTCTVILEGNSVGPNVGTATVTATGLDNANDDYKLPTSGLEKTLSITAPTTTLTFNVNSASLVYDGTAKTLGTVSYNGDGQAKYYVSTSNTTPGSSVTWTNISNGGEVKMTNAGTYYVFLQSTAGTNYPAVSVKLGNSTGKAIAQRPINITASSKSQAYNGSALTSNSATAEVTGTNRGLASGHSMTSYTVTGSQTYVGSSNNVPSAAVIKSGTTDVTANYAITYVNGTLTVTKADPQISIQGITADYTGGEFYAKVIGTKAKGTLYWKKGSAASTSDTAVTINSTGTPLSTPINITYVKNNVDDFVLYWYFVPSSAANSLASGHTYAENYNTAGGTSDDKVNLIIEPRSIANASASATAVTYNGSQQTASVSISDAGGNLTSNDYTISGNTGTNATNYTITITGRNNYTGTKTITWTINKRAVTITADSASKVYDGTALTKNSVTAAAQNNTNNTGMISSHHVHSWTVSGSQTLVGSSNNTVTAATIYDGTHSGTESNVTSNYAITYAVGTLTVTKRAITATATNQTKVYDGTKLTATNTGTVTNLPSNHTITYNCTGEIGPGVSTGTKTLSSVVIKNSGGTDITSSCFTVTKNNGTLSITKAALTYSNVSSVSEYCTASATARSTTDSAKTLEIATASASGVAGTSDTITYSTSQSGWSVSSDGLTLTVPANANAGTYNITVTASSANYDPVTNSVKVVINPVVLSTLALELTANTVAYGSATTVASLIATYSNGAFKDVKDDADTTYSATKDSANDDIVSITKE